VSTDPIDPSGVTPVTTNVSLGEDNTVPESVLLGSDLDVPMLQDQPIEEDCDSSSSSQPIESMNTTVTSRTSMTFRPSKRDRLYKLLSDVGNDKSENLIIRYASKCLAYLVCKKFKTENAQVISDVVEGTCITTELRPSRSVRKQLKSFGIAPKPIKLDGNCHEMVHVLKLKFGVLRRTPENEKIVHAYASSQIRAMRRERKLTGQNMAAATLAWEATQLYFVPTYHELAFGSEMHNPLVSDLINERSRRAPSQAS